MRTPLGQVRGLGSAKSGTGHFWKQRLTGMSNLVLSFFFVGLVIALVGKDHATAVATIGHPLVAVPLLLFFLSVALHMKIGMQVIIEDYVHGGAKVVLIALNTFFAVAVGAAAAFAILKISFGM